MRNQSSESGFLIFGSVQVVQEKLQVLGCELKGCLAFVEQVLDFGVIEEFSAIY